MTNHERIIISGMQILVEDDEPWLNEHALVIEAGLIKAIVPESMIAHHLPAKRYEYQASDRLVPGFIDLHVHGANGADVMDASEEALMALSKALAKEGVTRYLATTMTAESPTLEKVLTTIKSYRDNTPNCPIIGVHLEGPFISKMGAQREEAKQVPDWDLFEHWQKLAGNSIKIVTMAPELNNALPFIRNLTASGVIASIGHTHATYDQTNTAIQAGCSQATHLFNAMSGLHQREPGAVGALLLSEQITAELIVDGIHVHPAMVDLAYRLKTRERLVLVTDAMRAKCLAQGSYDLGGQMVQVKEGKAMLADGTLAGSVLRMNEAVKLMTTFTQCGLENAIYMASSVPARAVGQNLFRGSITVGKEADIVVMNAACEVILTMRAGSAIFSK